MKHDLGVNRAGAEKRVGGPQHLYIHWPFCKNKCHYCDFVALEGHNQFAQQYHEALCREVKEFVERIPSEGRSLEGLVHNQVSTIFFGGGTPSLYPLPQLKELFSLFNSSFTLAPAPEITLEVNPGGITHEHLATWKSLGFNRLSVGVQVLADEVLASLNRPQKTSDVIELMTMAPAYFDNISADLILGLPGVDAKTWQKTIEAAVTWPITHISIYFLTVHENTPLYHKIKKGTLRIMRDDAMVHRYEKTIEFIAAHGFEQYEVSNFAKKGFESLHNRAYWDRKPYKGFGLGSASFDGENRFTNEKNLTRYCGYWNEGTIPESSKSGPTHEQLTSQQAFWEVLMLGLRQKKGIDLHDVVYSLSNDEKIRFEEKIEDLKKRLLIKQDNHRIYLTQKGMALENEVILHLM